MNHALTSGLTWRVQLPSFARAWFRSACSRSCFEIISFHGPAIRCQAVPAAIPGGIILVERNGVCATGTAAARELPTGTLLF
jgi:hypothetical protein